MLRYVHWFILTLLVCIGVGCADHAADAPADRSSASTAAVDHHLKVVLDPARQRLSATDRLTIPAAPSSVAFRMAAHLSIDALSVNGKAAGYTQSHGSVAVAVEAPGKPVDITIAYSGIFDDQAPVEPLNTDNPGYGVTGTIGDQGTMLLAGAGWYPDAEGPGRPLRPCCRCSRGHRCRHFGDARGSGLGGRPHPVALVHRHSAPGASPCGRTVFGQPAQFWERDGSHLFYGGNSSI
jgi:hypothetical protein